MPLDGEWELIDRLSEDDLRRIENERDFSKLRQVCSDKDIDLVSASDFAWTLVAKKGLYIPAIALFEGLLRIEDSELGLQRATYLHERTHSHYGWLLKDITYDLPNTFAKDFGVPIEQLKFTTNANGGLHIEGSDIVKSAYSPGLSLGKKQENCLSRLHFNIAKVEHSNKDCPYLELLKQ